MWPLKAFDDEGIQYSDIITVPDVFTADEAKAVVALKNLAKSHIYNGGTTTFRTWDDIDTQWVLDKLTRLINEANASYFGMSLDYFYHLQIVEYDSIGLGAWEIHADTKYGQKTNVKKLTISIQLSSPEDYEGGEFRLYYSNFNSPVVADRRLGAATVFRSHILHGVEPVTKGIRHSLVTWANGSIPR